MRGRRAQLAATRVYTTVQRDSCVRFSAIRDKIKMKNVYEGLKQKIKKEEGRTNLLTRLSGFLFFLHPDSLTDEYHLIRLITLWTTSQPRRPFRLDILDRGAWEGHC